MSKSNKSISLRALKEKITDESFDNILIICHVNPDPDTLGSGLGLKQIFEKLNKTAYIACDAKVSGKICGYFDISPELDSDAIKSAGFEPDYIICVDAASVSQLGGYGDIYKNKIDIVIDHHYTNSFYGKATYLDEKAAAAGEIIFDLAKELNIGIERDKKFAKNIYCAVICDSGSFRYSSTTPKTMLTAAELISSGFDFAKLNRLIFQNKSIMRIAAERLAYNSLRVYAGGRISLITITEEMKKNAGIESAEFEGISDITTIIEGVEVGVSIRESEPEISEISEISSKNDAKKFRVSLRSNDYVNVAEIAAHFGGGGHVRAAGCTYEGRIDVLEKILIEKIEKVLMI